MWGSLDYLRKKKQKKIEDEKFFVPILQKEMFFSIFAICLILLFAENLMS